jgi:hypothetical protein
MNDVSTYRSGITGATVHVCQDDRGCYFNSYSTHPGASDSRPRTRHGKSVLAAQGAARWWLLAWERSEAERKSK